MDITPALRALAYAVVVAGGAIGVSSAQSVEEITVEASRPMRSATGAEIKTVSTNRIVSYRDISLTTASGVSVLETRIRDAATSACGELAQKYPNAAQGDSTDQCVDAAVNRAMADAHRAIGAARENSPGTYAAQNAPIQRGEEITVEAARGVGRSRTGASINTVTATRAVSYADLSLATASGAVVLENRIKDAARSACAELQQRYPVAAEGDTTQKCFNDAVASGMSDARGVIDAAKVASDSDE